MIQTPEQWEVLAKADPSAKPRQPCSPCARGDRSCQCGKPAPTPADVRAAAMPHEGRP